MIKVTLAFLVIPLTLGFVFNYLFSKVRSITKPEDYQLDFN